MTSALAELARVGGGDGFFGLVACECRAIAALLDEDRPSAMRELETGMAIARQLPVASPAPSFGLWALLRSLENSRRGCRRVTICGPRGPWPIPPTAASWRTRKRLTWVARGRPCRRLRAVADGDRTLVPGPWYLHYGRRLVAEAAIQDGWGEPGGLAARGRGLLRQNGYQAVASACRSLLRKCGAPMTSGRAHRGVPEPFRGQGVTEREMEVLAILADGLSNKDIGARLYLSPKTIEKHVASLMDKLEVRTRSQLATIAAANIWGVAPPKLGEIPDLELRR